MRSRDLELMKRDQHGDFLIAQFEPSGNLKVETC